MNRLSIIFIFILFSCSKEKKVQNKVIINPDYEKAFEYRESGKLDSAFTHFYKAKDVFLQQKDSLGVGKCLLNMAILSTDNGDYNGGQELSLNAQVYFDKRNKKEHVFIESNFNNLGIATDNLNDYKNSLRFYNMAIQFAKDSTDIRLYLNNKARVYQNIGHYNQAIVIYKEALAGASKNQREFARALSNLAMTKWLQNPNYKAEDELLKALHIRNDEHDLWGLNASYSHLSDYFAAKAPATALAYAEKMYSIALKLNSTSDRLEALQRLIKLGSSHHTKQYFLTYKKLDDSVQAIRNNAKNQFALIKYESAKSKADNLMLQQDNLKKDIQLIVLLFCTAIAGVILVLWYKRRREKLALETEKSIRDSQLKTSKKVHDVVANGLYRVMTEIENEFYIDRDQLLDKIENLYEKSRDISYDDHSTSNKPFNETITKLLTSFANEERQVVIAGNETDMWERVNEDTKYELEHIIQELMVNMKKHSEASNVLFRFEEVENQINIFYADNGRGMSEEAKFNNGLRNTGNRIEAIKGTIIFDTKQDKGLKIQISFPT